MTIRSQPASAAAAAISAQGCSERLVRPEAVTPAAFALAAQSSSTFFACAAAASSYSPRTASSCIGFAVSTMKGSTTVRKVTSAFSAAASCQAAIDGAGRELRRSVSGCA